MSFSVIYLTSFFLQLGCLGCVSKIFALVFVRSLASQTVLAADNVSPYISLGIIPQNRLLTLKPPPFGNYFIPSD